ncbi:hypothetical protein RRG08_023822 [Elysia crispata]|uniref:G-protein coupled receptors family 1 profile domain-containing protein n=1 Tax=Elysia crispata TaxID=231223 RepID=A0AAE0ZW30_9GAST|nr:hypothetical protein RRG08_023822 [Elysia crispata]
MPPSGDLLPRDDTVNNSTSIINYNDSFILIESGLTTIFPKVRGACTVEHYHSVGKVNYFVACFGVALICENILLITIIARTRSLHTNTNILVASLAVTDVLMGFQCFMYGMTGLNVGFRFWLAKGKLDILHIYDSVMLGVNCSLVAVSLLHVSLLAVDRYLYISWPFRYTRQVTRNRVLAVAAGIWTLGLTYMFLPLALFQASQYRQTCILVDVPEGYGCEPLAVGYAASLAVVFYCTAKMIKLAREHRVGRNKKFGENWILKRRSGKKLDENVFSIAYEFSQASPKLSIPINPDGDDMSNKKIGAYTNITASPIFDAGVKEVLNETLLPHDEDSKNNKSYIFSAKMENGSDNDFKSVEATIISNNEIAVKDLISSSGANCKYLLTTKNKDKRKIIIASGAPGQERVRLSSNADIKPVFRLRNSNNKNEEKYRLLRKTNLKILKFVLIVLGTFLVCTFPAIAILSVIKIMKVSLFSNKYFVIDVMHFLITSNSGMNFLTITYMNKEFRKGLVKIFPFCDFNCCMKKMRM